MAKDRPPRISWTRAADWRASGEPALAPSLARGLAAGVRGLWSAEECAAAASAVMQRRGAWTADFGGEQFALGRAFYTHLETGRAGEYFKYASRSDALVEATLPGMQARVRALYGRLAGGRVRTRPGFCGPGVHVFPAGEKVAREGGVVHFDTEGISPLHLERRARALTLVIMLQPPTRGGGLRVWDVRYRGRDAASPAELRRTAATALYRAGDALLLESYRLHQIQGFTGRRDRISVTLHGVEVDAGVWETWF
jgi:hypothetical protein